MKNNQSQRIDPETIKKAREMDLLTYLQHYEPHNLVRTSRREHRTKDHDSLKISNGKWYWWSKGIGGASALDYLIKVKGYDFLTAVETITGVSIPCPLPPPVPKKELPKDLSLPPKHEDSEGVIQYLFKRGIDYQLITNCIADGTIYESSDYHNAIFIGKDTNGVPRYASIRGINSDFKGDALGSDKRYSFRLMADTTCQTVRLFESAIDLLSYATYLEYENKSYENTNLLSLSGVHQPSREGVQSKIPIALEVFLKENPQIKTIVLHFDNDRAGRLSTKNLISMLKNNYEIVDEPPPSGKDYNDFLLSYMGISKSKSNRERGDAR